MRSQVQAIVEDEQKVESMLATSERVFFCNTLAVYIYMFMIMPLMPRFDYWRSLTRPHSPPRALARTDLTGLALLRLDYHHVGRRVRFRAVPR